jgi:hypothetical protein
MNCNHAFPSEPFVSDFAICLNDLEFEPYLDDLLENQAALDALCIYLKDLPAPASLEETHLRAAILRQLTHTRSHRLKLAKLLVEDLFRTPSNNTTRGWYTAVFHFFETSSADIAEKALSPMLDSPQFSYRIKKRVKGILSPVNDESQGYW